MHGQLRELAASPCWINSTEPLCRVSLLSETFPARSSQKRGQKGRVLCGVLVDAMVSGSGRKVCGIYILKSEHPSLPWSLLLKPLIINFGDRVGLSGTWNALTKYLLALE